MRTALVVFLFTSALLPATARANDPLIEVHGGGPKNRDCYATLKANANRPKNNPRHIRCVDGDPTCDADGVVDGVCTFAVSVCANSTFDPTHCTSGAISSIDVAHGIDNGTDPDFDTDFLALQTAIDSDIAPPTAAADVCTSVVNIRVRIKGPTGRPPGSRNHCRPNKKILQLFTAPQPLIGPGDTDKHKLICVPADDTVNGCDPQTLFTSTFDRLQKQVFSTSCAVGTCHDSESYLAANGLLLESGAAYSNLVGVDPQNALALSRGWKRVNPGDPTTSLLYHKIDNDLDDPGLGLRMPRPPGRPRLHRSLREIIRLWIEDGAPASGWVTGTD